MERPSHLDPPAPVPAPDVRAAPADRPARDAAWDVVVVGGGHAGIEAALAAARVGARVALVSLHLDKVGEMSCNPAIGGLGKGQIVREIDALGGAMGLVADATGIQFRMLNTGKGHAVRAPRCQSDRHRYREHVTALVAAEPGIELVEGAGERLVIEGDAGAPRVAGLCLADGRVLRARTVVVTTGTFLRAVMHTGESQTPGGRAGEGSSGGISDDLARLGLALGRLKTGTPPRLAADGRHVSPLWPPGRFWTTLPFSSIISKGSGGSALATARQQPSRSNSG
jgi:tRNA uridine 5-carboxymethylaminomethyl modification enzyme